MGKEETLSLLNYQAEIDRLNKKIYFLEKENRELKAEISDFEEREKQLLSEINSLEEERNDLLVQLRPKIKPENKALTANEFLFPKVTTGTGIDRSNRTGFEDNWKDFMYAYTDEIFIENNTPDLLLYRDETEKCYVSPSGHTRLPFPILQEDLERLNILSIRPLTNQEIDEIIDEYQLN